MIYGFVKNYSAIHFANPAPRHPALPPLLQGEIRSSSCHAAGEGRLHTKEARKEGERNRGKEEVRKCEVVTRRKIQSGGRMKERERRRGDVGRRE